MLEVAQPVLRVVRLQLQFADRFLELGDFVHQPERNRERQSDSSFCYAFCWYRARSPITLARSELDGANIVI